MAPLRAAGRIEEKVSDVRKVAEMEGNVDKTIITVVGKDTVGIIAKVCTYLADNDIQTLIHYPTPPHHQEAYRQWAQRSYPITEEIHRTVLSLPISPVMTDDEVQRVEQIVNAWK